MAEFVRLLLCFECKTTEQIPDYEGPSAADDTLTYAIHPHKYPTGTPHNGQLMRVEKKHWDSPSTRRAIENQIRESAGHTGLDTEFYATKDTLAEDAMKCWAAHNRNPGCSDYKSSKKRLSAGTDHERKKMGLLPLASKTYLCDFCPVKSIVQQKVFEKRGLYND